MALLAAFGGCVAEMGDVDESETEQAALVAPSGVTATPTSSSRITVSWSAVAGATKYYIYQAPAAAGPYAFRTTVVAPGTAVSIANLQPATQYCFVLRADGPAGVSPNSAPAACATTLGTAVAPAVPTGVTATATSSSRISVSWTAVSGATAYYVYQSTGSAGPYPFINTVTAPGTTLSIANLQPNTLYCFRVASTNGVTSAQSDPPACARTFVFGLEGFWSLDELAGTSATDTSGFGRNATLAGATTFSTDHAPMDGNRGSVVVSAGTANALEMADAGPYWFTGSFTLSLWVKLPSTTGTYVIAGKRNTGCGTTNWELAHSDAGGLTFRGTTTTSFGVSLSPGRWTHVAITGVSGGSLSAYVDGLPVASGTFTAGPRSSSPLQFGNSGGCGNPGQVLVDEIQLYSRQLTDADIATIGVRPAAPATLTATANSATTTGLSWAAVPNATKYFIYRGTSPGNVAFLTTVLAPTTTFNGVSLAPGTTYYWQVRATTVSKLISDPSPEASATTFPPPSAPTGVTATTVSSSRIRVDWAAQAGVQKFYIYQTGGIFKGTVFAPGTTFTVANLTANTTYGFYVVADAGGGLVSAASATATATTLP